MLLSSGARRALRCEAADANGDVRVKERDVR